jgi:transposase InsO family protein
MTGSSPSDVLAKCREKRDFTGTAERSLKVRSPRREANALAETINGLYKAEVIHRCGPWRSFEAVEYATLEWVDWFNHRRLLEPIGNIPPAEAEDQYYAAADNIDMAA